MNNLTLLDHPVLRDKLGRLRNRSTPSQEFRVLIKEIATFLCYEACRKLPVKTVEIDTPMGRCSTAQISREPTIIAIMRAGNGMADAINSVIPKAHTGHVGIYRDKFIRNTVEYYFKVPLGTRGSQILLVDPLIATGDTAVACIDRLKESEPDGITFLTILASEKGLALIGETHPDVHVMAIEIEQKLDEEGYLVPGLGDVGDRFYNTR